jgi:hypothetical protein
MPNFLLGVYDLAILACLQMSRSRAQQYKSRCVLSASQASEIYQLNFMASTSASDPSSTGQEVSYSILLGAQYGVSSKTIRDIWNRKTWIHVTEPLFNQKQASPSRFAYHEYLDRQVRIAQAADVFVCCSQQAVCLQNKLQLRPSKVGRPKGSRNKVQRAKQIDQATPSSQDHFYSFESAIDTCKSSTTADQSPKSLYCRCCIDSSGALPPEPALPALGDGRGAIEQPSVTRTFPFDAHRFCAPDVPETTDSLAAAAPDAAAPGHGGPGFADPFHFDWPHW